MKYLLAYAVDVPHYTDFVVEARNQKAALAKARKALSDGKFSHLLGTPCIENSIRERVFSQGPMDKEDAKLCEVYDDLKDIIKENEKISPTT